MEYEIKQNFSRNLAILRKSKNLTQAQLAEKLNYSDKSVSKWECGDVLPDVVTLSMIAQFFSVTIDQLIGKHEPKQATKSSRRLLITSLSCFLVCFIATLVFIVCSAFNVGSCWLIYIYALPCTSIVATVFCSIWYSNKAKTIAVSLLVWSLGLAVYLSLIVFISLNLWFIFILCLVFQILVILWFILMEKLSKRS